jgi:hypothetical protein
MDPSSAGTIDRSNDAAARRLNRLNCKNSCGLRVEKCEAAFSLNAKSPLSN